MISGALVLVAAVLLVVGIISSITLVYAAIGLSIVSAVFLLVGVFQRPPASTEPRESESDFTRRSPSRDADVEPDRLPRSLRRTRRRSVSKRKPRPARMTKRSTTSTRRCRTRRELRQSRRDDAADLDDAEEVAADFPLEKANADFEERSGATGADVLVISGRPRYHVGGCEFVEGNDD